MTQLTENLKQILAPARAFVSKRPELGDLVRVQSADGSQHLAEVVVEDIERDDITRGCAVVIEHVNAVEQILARGYDLFGKRVDYDLQPHCGTDGGTITNSYSDRTVWLQGSDFYELEKQIGDIWKQVRWKKMGQNKAQILVNDLLSQYFEEV